MVFYTSVDRYKNDILFRGYNSKTRRSKKTKIRYSPTLYVPTSQPTTFKSIDGKPVAPVKPGSMYDCRQFIQRYQHVDNFEIHGNQNYVHQFIGEIFEQDVIEFDASVIDTCYVDIEVKSDQHFAKPEVADQPITAITLKHSTIDKFYTWGYGDYDSSNTIANQPVIYVKCSDEQDLLSKFLTHWINNYPDIISGWNVRLYDIVYLINRLIIVLGEDRARSISPWKLISSDMITINQNNLMVYEITGIQQLDYLDVFRKFGLKYGQQESYKLDNIGSVVLGVKKLDYSEYSSLHALYVNDHQKFIEYNIRDCQLVESMNQKDHLIELCMSIAYKAKVNFSEVFGPVGVWDALLYNRLKSNNVIVPSKKQNDKTKKIEGAYVKDPPVGRHPWIVSFDVNSLYPHVMMQFNMSPETVVDDKAHYYTIDQLLDKPDIEISSDRCFAGSGYQFRTDIAGYIPKLVSELYQQRSTIRKRMIEIQHLLINDPTNQQLRFEESSCDNQQQSIKILMNSLYGAMSNQFFRFFDIRIAESITLTGQIIIRFIQQAVNKYLNETFKTDNVDYVVASDTDSVYITLANVVANVKETSVKQQVAIIDQFCENNLQKIIDATFEEIRQYTNCMQQLMKMKREVIADVGIWTGKKHYVLNVHNSEQIDYPEPKLKIVGIEAIKSSTPQICKQIIKDGIKLMINADERTIQQFISGQQKEFNKYRAEDIAFPRSVNNLQNYHDKQRIFKEGTPINARAALLYNKLLVDHKLTSRYELIMSGQKIKFIYLKTPNPIHQNVIGFIDILPEEFGLHQYIDGQLQFEKTVIQPLKQLIDAVGWDIIEKPTLDQLFF